MATPVTQAAWVARAQQRTIKHLREEVVGALVAVRVSGEADCPPPAEVEMAAFHELEQAVMSGSACQPRPANDSRVERDVRSVLLAEPASDERRAWLVMLGSLSQWLEGGLQLSAAGGNAGASRVGSSAGRTTLRLRVTRATYAWWRGLEARARRSLPRGMSFLSFLCLSIWQAWRHLLGADGAYGQIYIRDRYRCTSPVCSRKDVTPHHLQFRSAGGSDTPANTTSVCTWCHLCGVHVVPPLWCARGATSVVCTAVAFAQRAAPSSFTGSWGRLALLASWCMGGSAWRHEVRVVARRRHGTSWRRGLALWRHASQHGTTAWPLAVPRWPCSRPSERC